VWLRTPGWLYFDNGFVSDVQNGGLTFISGGDYSRSSVPLGYWAVATRSVFVGETQPKNPFAQASGPKGPGGKLICENQRGDACISKNDGVVYLKSNWGAGQRLFNIYDGPAHQEANAYLDIATSACLGKDTCLYFGTPGVRRNPLKTGTGFLPNAAIGWKQPNGFYYPPAFHSKGLFFNNVDIRHYVIQPLYKPGTYLDDSDRVASEFIGGVEGAPHVMGSFTDIDRQTELTDEDGSLTGLSGPKNVQTNLPGETISVNQDGFFSAPIQAAQCKSNSGIDPTVACAGKVAEPPCAE
jgi:hypothetical protein